MAPARSKVLALATLRPLVAAYAANPTQYRSTVFDETSTRTAFIDRLSEALGWNVTSAPPDREIVFHVRTSRTWSTAGEEEWDKDRTQEQLNARAEPTEIPGHTFSVDGFVRSASRPSARTLESRARTPPSR